MAKFKTTWDARWEKGERLGEGGTGTVFRARRLGDEEFKFAIKLLNKNGDSERRQRLTREAAALGKLSHPLIPRLIETNASSAPDDEALYIVMTYVDGPTLEQAVAAKRLQLQEAVEMTSALVEVVGVCNDHGITHRDVKPDNIVLRGGDHRAPTLIDFGQCADPDDSHLTGLQDVGTRFLRLPEHIVPGDDRRELRSDLALCCAVLFFSITGINPAALRDSQSRPPHRRPDAEASLAVLTNAIRIRVTHLFDIGFQDNVELRWQSASQLLNELTQLCMETLPDEPTTDGDALAFSNVWTLKIANGQLESVYVMHWVQEGHRLLRYWRETDRTDFEPIANFSEDVRRAASVLWQDVSAMPTVATAMIRGRRPYTDSVSHSLSSAPLLLKWSGEQTGPNGMEQVPGLDVGMRELSSPHLRG